MSERFLGIPLLVWGAICLVVAVVWAVFWPAERAVGATGLRLLLIRWGHSATWALLAAMCFMRVSGSKPLLAWSQPVGLAALFIYLAFLAASFVLR